MEHGMIEQLHIYAKLKILKLQDLVKLETAAFVYNYKSGQLPSTFRNYLTAPNDIHVNRPKLPPHIIFLYLFLKLWNFKGLLNIKVQKYETH